MCTYEMKPKGLLCIDSIMLVQDKKKYIYNLLKSLKTLG